MARVCALHHSQERKSSRKKAFQLTTSSIAQFAVLDAMDSIFYALDSVSLPSLAFPRNTFSAYLIVPQYAPEGVCVFVC